MAYTLISTQFDKVSGWNDGPKKPTSTKVEGTATNIQSALSTISTNVANLAAGEDIIVIISNRG